MQLNGIPLPHYLIGFSATVKRLTLNDLVIPFLRATAF